MRERKAISWVMLFFILLTIIGLISAPDYGLPCDEPAEQVILQENLNEYAHVLLGDQSAAAKYYNSLGVGRISESIERDHGQSAYYLAAPLLTLQTKSPALAMALWHGYTWLWFMVGALSLYVLLRGLGLDRLLACAGVLLMYLSPRFFAEGHYNNKDVVLLSLTLLTLATGWRLMAKPTWRRALLFSLAGALTANTKIVGLFVWGLMGLATLVRLIARKELTSRAWFAGAVALVSFLLMYLLITPAAWINPLGYVNYVIGNATGFSRWSGVVLFQGTLYNPTRGLLLPRTYLPLMVLYTVPPATLLLAAIGQLHVMMRMLKRDPHTPLLLALTLLWLVPMAYVMVARPLMYNGWRHFYFLFAGILAMAGLGLGRIAALLRNRKLPKAIAAIALVAMFALQGVGILQNHPYQYAYYTLFAQNAQSDLELDYWLVSTANAMRRLVAEKGTYGSAPLLLGARDPMSFFGVEQSIKAMSLEEQTMLAITEDEDAPYILSNTTYAAIYGIAKPEGYTALFSLESYGNVIVTIYQRDVSTN